MAIGQGFNDWKKLLGYLAQYFQCVNCGSNSVTHQSKLPYPERKELPSIIAALYDRLFGQDDIQNETEKRVVRSEVEVERQPAKKARAEQVKELLEKDEMYRGSEVSTLKLIEDEVILL